LKLSLNWRLLQCPFKLEYYIFEGAIENGLPRNYIDAIETIQMLKEMGDID
jgi:hypothetical protein